MATKPREYVPTQGNSPYMTTDNPQGTYGQRLYQAPTMDQPGPMQGMSPPIMEAHDRVALVQGRPCAPGQGTERHRAAVRSLDEEGRSLSAATHAHLDAAHDALAKHLGLQCGSMGTGESHQERQQLREIKQQVEELKMAVQPRKAQPYQPGNYLKEKVRSLDWAEMADRTAPLPESLDVTLLLKEFEQLLALQYDDRYKILSFTL